MTKTLLTAAAVALVAGLNPASAGVIYLGGTGGTSFGASNYVCCNGGAPTWIANNFTTAITGQNDILSSPGGGWQTANPVVANNVASTGVVNAPYWFGWIGGNAPLSGAPFGSGLVVNLGPQVGFSLSDPTVGGGTASYMITSMINNYQVDNAGFNGTFGDYVAIQGRNFAGADASVAAIRGAYNINGGGWVALPDIMLALAGNCNDQVAGTFVAKVNQACANGGNGGAFAGLAIGMANGGAAFNLGAGATISVVTTLTVYADPSDIGSLGPSTLFNDLLTASGGSLPGFSIGDTGVNNPAPEPGTWVALGGGLLALGIARRRRA